jgi:hypothetical protein
MSGLEYANIPQCATQIKTTDVRTKPKLVTSIPKLSASSESTSPTAVQQPTSPTKQPFNLPHLLLSSSLHLPNPPPSSPRDGALLLSNREALSLQTTTVNFRRFVSKSGPVFWLQDRIEEIVMWRKGWKVTCTWMAIYVFLCMYCRCAAASHSCAHSHLLPQVIFRGCSSYFLMSSLFPFFSLCMVLVIMGCLNLPAKRSQPLSLLHNPKKAQLTGTRISKLSRTSWALCE